jgi:hypothetical protein
VGFASHSCAVKKKTRESFGLAADEDVVVGAQVRKRHGFLVDDEDAELAFGATTSTSPESGMTDPVRILMSVDFPAPFSPQSAWTSPRAMSMLTPRSACTPP